MSGNAKQRRQYRRLGDRFLGGVVDALSALEKEIARDPVTAQRYAREMAEGVRELLRKPGSAHQMSVEKEKP